ncbi:MAG: hypothetical protein DWQ02_03030, partial [Bacteroidetes bacterium]
MIKITEVKKKQELKHFIHLPFKVHKYHKEWVPPLLSDEWTLFDKNKNHSFEFCDTTMLLAEKDGEVVGRIMGIINHMYNEAHGEKAARFCFMECFDDEEVFDELLSSVENWGREKGMEKMVGPLGFSDKDPQGFLIEGFEDPVSVMITNCSLPYMVTHTERNGYQKKIDLYQYRLIRPNEIPEVYLKIAERVKSRGLEIIPLKRSKQVRPWVGPVFDLINETYTEIYGFAPLTERESREFADRFLPLLNPEFIKLIKNADDELVGFVVAMPDIGPGIKKAKGRILPFGFVHILRSMRNSKQLNLLLGCVKNTVQNSGLDALLAVELFKSAKKKNLKVIDSHLVMEENVKMRATFERLGGTCYKK